MYYKNIKFAKTTLNICHWLNTLNWVDNEYIENARSVQESSVTNLPMRQC